MPAETVADSSSAQTLVGLSLALKYVNANQERYRKMLAVSCQMASFRGAWRNRMVTKTKPTILAQPNTCEGSQSLEWPTTSTSARGPKPWPAAMNAIEYVTSKIVASQNAIMVGCLAFSCIVLPEPCGSSSDLSSRRQRRQVVLDGNFASPNNRDEQCSGHHPRDGADSRAVPQSVTSMVGIEGARECAGKSGMEQVVKVH